MRSGSQVSSHPVVEGLEGPSYVVLRSNRGHVEAVTAGPGGQLEFFHSVDDVGSGVAARHWLDDEGLVLKSDDASAETVQHVIECDSLQWNV